MWVDCRRIVRGGIVGTRGSRVAVECKAVCGNRKLVIGKAASVR